MPVSIDFISNQEVEIRCKNSRTMVRIIGDIDISKEILRIKNGLSVSHRNDGAIFGNRETILPLNYHGYYHEYVLSPPLGAALWCVFNNLVLCSFCCYFPGPMRLVYGAGGEIFFTSDHYVTFVRVK